MGSSVRLNDRFNIFGVSGRLVGLLIGWMVGWLVGWFVA